MQTCYLYFVLIAHGYFLELSEVSLGDCCQYLHKYQETKECAEKADTKWQSYIF